MLGDMGYKGMELGELYKWERYCNCFVKWVCGFVWFRNIWWLARKYIKNENNLEECEIEYENNWNGE